MQRRNRQCIGHTLLGFALLFAEGLVFLALLGAAIFATLCFFVAFGGKP